MDYRELNALVYLGGASLISFLLMIVDKASSKRKKRRIKESTFFLLAIFGGSAAIYFSMGLLNHKTQKNSFVFIIPIIFALQCVAVYILNKYVFGM